MVFKRDKIFVGDCRELLKIVPTNSTRLIHTSPPYNIGRGYNDYEDYLSFENYHELIGTVVNECYRILKPGGSVFWQTGYTKTENGYILPLDVFTFDIFKIAGFKCKDRIIWRYFGGRSFKNKFTNKHETIYWWVKPGSEVFFNIFPIREESKEDDPRNNLFGRNPGNVWEVDRVAYGSKGKTSHVAVFPEEISDRIILSGSLEGDLCIDPFMGSGTLCKVAKSRARHFVGFEISPEYYEEAEDRLFKTQSSEFLNVFSGLINYYLEKEFTGHAFLSSLIDFLSCSFKRDWETPIRNLIGKKILNIIASGDEIGLTKKEKKKTWATTRKYLGSKNIDKDILLLIDRSYLSKYKIHKNFNGPMRLYKILNWVKTYEAKVGTDKELLKELILNVVRAEPLTFKIKKDYINLMENYIILGEKQAPAEPTQQSEIF